MKHGALVALCVAAAFAFAQAQGVAFPNFPYCQCIKSPSPYSMEQTVKSFGNGTYCFTLDVKQPLSTVTGYCAARADVRKIEFNVNKACDVFGPVVNATVNGVPTRVGAAFDAPAQGPDTAMILRLTQLDLNLTSDGTEICITLGRNERGRGCATLEELCVPPSGAPIGSCSIALFDTRMDCCPISRVGVLSPPPVPPPSPAPPPPPSPPPSSVPVPTAVPCDTCTYISITPTPPNANAFIYPLTIAESDCKAVAQVIESNIREAAAGVGAVVLDGSVVTCYEQAIKICVRFASKADAQKLQPQVDNALSFWLGLVTKNNTCPAYLNYYTTTVTVAGNGDPAAPPESDCLNGTMSVSCSPEKVDFPKCFCDTRPRATRFAAIPFLEERAARPNNRTNATQYCFTVIVVDPILPTGTCGSTTILLKAEIWGNDIATQRRKILGVAITPGNSNVTRFISPSWGSAGEQTLKVSPLNWSAEQADGAKICMELSSATDLPTFCNSGTETCWINFFSPNKDCCPLFSASLL